MTQKKAILYVRVSTDEQADRIQLTTSGRKTEKVL